MIEASIATQYGVRVRQQARIMTWSEFCVLIAGLMPETPLGAVISIRSERDSKTIKAFSPAQKKIHAEWRSKMAAKKVSSPEALKRDMENLEAMLASMFGGGSK